MKGDRREPIAAPSTCSKNWSSNIKYVACRHNSVSSQMALAGMLVRSSRVSSEVRRWEMFFSASSSGTLVKRLTTSKLTMVVSVSVVSCRILLANSADFFTKESTLLYIYIYII